MFPFIVHIEWERHIEQVVRLWYLQYCICRQFLSSSYESSVVLDVTEAMMEPWNHLFYGVTIPCVEKS